MSSKELDFLVSALTDGGPFMETEEFLDWLEGRREVHRFNIEPIPFSALDQWAFERTTGNLVHSSGKFFTIEGIWVETNFGPVSQWSQPIIDQPEVGLLGFLTKKFNGVLHFLAQAKMEPGNINLVQLAPTLQATRSNYTQVHRGATPPYLEYFLDRSHSRVLVDVLQSEQGARFLQKRNRNIIIETEADVPVLDDYCWLTLGQIHKLLGYDNVVNMDARTVLSSIPFAAPEVLDGRIEEVSVGLGTGDEVALSDLLSDRDDFQTRVFNSLINTQPARHSTDELISWFTELKVRYELQVERMPLKYVKNWLRTDHEIVHEAGKYFAVMAVAVEATSREVSSWTQPIVRPQEEGIVAYLMQNIDGVLHFLVQGKVEPGNLDIVEMAPTVQCMTGSYRQCGPDEKPPFLDYVLNVRPEQIKFSTHQSEEGGRFFQEQNWNLLVEVEQDFGLDIPDNYVWMTLNQLKRFIKYNNFVNVSGRCLLACLGLAQ